MSKEKKQRNNRPRLKYIITFFAFMFCFLFTLKIHDIKAASYAKVITVKLKDGQDATTEIQKALDEAAKAGTKKKQAMVKVPAGTYYGSIAENTYDLYYFNEPTSQWKNYEKEAFNIEHQKGYLYANGETGGTTLEFSGTLQPSDKGITINGLSHEATTLNGFNLVGNPFACNATVDQDCYVISGNKVILAETKPQIAPCEGIIVKADESNNSVTFTKAAPTKGDEPTNSFDLMVTHEKALFDRARVRFGEGHDLGSGRDGDKARSDCDRYVLLATVSTTYYF